MYSVQALAVWCFVCPCNHTAPHIEPQKPRRVQEAPRGGGHTASSTGNWIPPPIRTIIYEGLVLDEKLGCLIRTGLLESPSAGLSAPESSNESSEDARVLAAMDAADKRGVKPVFEVFRGLGDSSSAHPRYSSRGGVDMTKCPALLFKDIGEDDEGTT